MLRTELKETVDSMPAGERIELVAYLKMKELVEDHSFREDVDKRFQAMKSGARLSSDDLEELNKLMDQKGL
jgi:hypothetical protein